MFFFIGDNSFSPSRWADIVQPLGSILSQIISRKLPRACDYNGMPAPWVQVRIIDLFGLLGEGNASASAKMYEPLGAALRAALGFRLSVSSMVIYSVVKAVTRIVPDKALLGLAAAQIGTFLRSGQPNLRYLGIRAISTALNSGGGSESGFSAVFASKPQFQMAVVECLESNDDTLRHETLDILYHMTSAANAQAITARMLDALRRDVGGPSSEHLRRALAAKIAQIVDRCAPSPQWALETLCAVLEAARDFCPESVPEALARTLDPRCCCAAVDPDYAKFAVDWFVAKVAESLAPGARRLPAGLARIAAFTLGEHGHVAQCGAQAVVQHLLGLAEKFHDVPDVLGPLMSSIAKLCGRAKVAPEPVLALFERMKSSANVDLQQRAYEHAAVLANLASAHILVTGASRHVKPDASLAFLGAFVSTAIANGAKPYKPAALAGFDAGIDGLSAAELLHIEDSASSAGPVTDLNVAAYPTPQKQAPPAAAQEPRYTPHDVMESSAVPAALLSDPEVAAEATKPSISSIGVAKKSKWSLNGYNANPKAPEPATAAAPSPMAPTTNVFAQEMAPAVVSTPVKQQQQQQQQQRQQKSKMSAEEQRKARIAQDLFGFSSSSSATATPKKPNPPAQTAPAPAPRSATADLLGLDIGITAAPAPAPAQPAVSINTGSSNNLLDILGGDMPASSTAAPSNSNNSGGNDLLSMGLANISLSSFSANATTNNASAALTSSSGTSPFNTGTYSHPSVIHIANIPNSAFMSREVTPYLPSASTNATLVASSGAVGLYTIPLLFKDCYGIALVISNESEGELAYANTVQVQVPAAAPITCEIGAVALGAQKQGAGKVALEKVPAKCTPVCVCRLEMRQAGIQQVVKVAVSINSASGSIDVGMKDFLREVKKTTKEVGSVWQKHNQEKKVAVKASDIRTAVSKVVSTLHAHCAEIINEEAILVVQVASKMQPLCLIHCRFNKATQQANVAIRSESPFLTDSVARALI